MEYGLNIFYVIAGLAALAFGANWLISGAVRLSLRLQVPSALVGVSIVAFGTSAPELVTSIFAAFRGSEGLELATGTIIGSNISNIAFILGSTALFYPLKGDQALLRWDVPWFLVSVLGLGLFIWLGQSIAGEAGAAESVLSLVPWEGSILLICLFGFLVTTFIRTRRSRSAPEEVQEELQKLDQTHWWKDLALFLGGLATLLIGAERLVEGASELARSLGIPPIVVGLTVVALGTSLPELATSFIAARRGENDLSLSNVAGSNIQNILLCLALVVVLNPSGFMAVDRATAIWDLSVLIGLSLLFVGFLLFGGKITRPRAAFLLLVYIAYIGYQVSRAIA